eukprot:scaffold79385_cov64-Phaeocystis_antarctica.AAC.4
MKFATRARRSPAAPHAQPELVLSREGEASHAQAQPTSCPRWPRPPSRPPGRQCRPGLGRCGSSPPRPSAGSTSWPPSSTPGRPPRPSRRS